MLDASSKHTIKSFHHFTQDINQLYHPTGKIPQDSQGVVYAFEVVNTTKFLPILLKEWFYLIKKGGYLIIDYKPNEFCDWERLEEYMWWLWEGKYKIVFHNSIDRTTTENLNFRKLKKFIVAQENYDKKDFNKKTFLAKLQYAQTIPSSKKKYLRFVVQKEVSTEIPGDSINKWTIGIITNGKREDWIEKIIQSIRNQKIYHLEIIICGTYYARKEKDIIYIPFNKRDDRGWITKKKNLIVERATHNNICIIHDRLIFNDDWFSGFKKYGNTFDALSCVQVVAGGFRAGDWLTINGEHTKKTFLFQNYHIEALDYRDWDIYAYISQVTIFKKSIWQGEKPWDERLYWNGGEDTNISIRMQRKGNLIRFNPYSSFHVLAWRHGDLPLKPFSLFTSKKRSGIFVRKNFMRNIMRKLLYYIAQMPGGNDTIQFIYNKTSKIQFYKYYQRH